MRLIDADELVKELTRPAGLSSYCERCTWSISNECVDCIVEDMIKHMPTIEPVKRGKWLLIYEDWRKQISGSKCSICGYEHFCDSYIYCPKCGSKNELVEEGEEQCL